MVGDEIQVAVSMSTDSQYTVYMATHISYRFWDTGVKVKDNPCLTMEFATDDGALPHGNYSGNGVYHTFGFVTAPEGGIANIDLRDNGNTGNYGTSWSSSRWTTIRHNAANDHSSQFNTRQGGANVSGFSSNISLKDDNPTNYRQTYRKTEKIMCYLDGTFRYTNGLCTANYAGANGNGTYSTIKTITTDSEIGQNSDLGDHNIYIVVAVGRKAAGGAVQTIRGKYTVWVQ